METIQIVIDTQLLKQTDQTAHKLKVNRSELVRMALREHIRRQEIMALEEQDRKGYEKIPSDPAEFAIWEGETEWPPE